VIRVFGNRRGAIDFASRVHKLERVQKSAAQVALIAAGIWIGTRWALAFDEAVCKKRMVHFTEELRSSLFLEKPIIVQLAEDILCDFRLKFRRGPAENVKANVEPLVYVGMDNAVFGTELLRRALFDEGPRFGCRSIFVGS
jgi:hypothetical protein